MHWGGLLLLAAGARATASPLIRSAGRQALSIVEADGEPLTEAPDQVDLYEVVETEGVLFPNCSAAEVAVVKEVSDCSNLDVLNCSNSFVLNNGVKSVCAVSGERCLDRGSAFCCYSTGDAELCDKKPRRVLSCSTQTRPVQCSRAFERHEVGEPGDRAIMVACAWDGMQRKCVGRESPLSDMACGGVRSQRLGGAAAAMSVQGPAAKASLEHGATAAGYSAPSSAAAPAGRPGQAPCKAPNFALAWQFVSGLPGGPPQMVYRAAKSPGPIQRAGSPPVAGMRSPRTGAASPPLAIRKSATALPPAKSFAPPTSHLGSTVPNPNGRVAHSGPGAGPGPPQFGRAPCAGPGVASAGAATGALLAPPGSPVAGEGVAGEQIRARINSRKRLASIMLVVIEAQPPPVRHASPPQPMRIQPQSPPMQPQSPPDHAGIDGHSPQPGAPVLVRHHSHQQMRLHGSPGAERTTSPRPCHLIRHTSPIQRKAPIPGPIAESTPVRSPCPQPQTVIKDPEHPVPTQMIPVLPKQLSLGQALPEAAQTNVLNAQTVPGIAIPGRAPATARTESQRASLYSTPPSDTQVPSVPSQRASNATLSPPPTPLRNHRAVADAQQSHSLPPPPCPIVTEGLDPAPGAMQLLWTLRCSSSEAAVAQRSLLHQWEAGCELPATQRVGQLFQKEFFESLLGQEDAALVDREHFQIWAVGSSGSEIGYNALHMLVQLLKTVQCRVPSMFLFTSFVRLAVSGQAINFDLVGDGVATHVVLAICCVQVLVFYVPAELDERSVEGAEYLASADLANQFSAMGLDAASLVVEDWKKLAMEWQQVNRGERAQGIVLGKRLHAMSFAATLTKSFDKYQGGLFNAFIFVNRGERAQGIVLGKRLHAMSFAATLTKSFDKYQGPIYAAAVMPVDDDKPQFEFLPRTACLGVHDRELFIIPILIFNLTISIIIIIIVINIVIITIITSSPAPSSKRAFSLPCVYALRCQNLRQRNHCSFFLTNFSSNGTMVNDQQLSIGGEQVPLCDGDRIVLLRPGSASPLMEFRFDLSGSLLKGLGPWLLPSRHVQMRSSALAPPALQTVPVAEPAPPTPREAMPLKTSTTVVTDCESTATDARVPLPSIQATIAEKNKPSEHQTWEDSQFGVSC
ncbi:hypothetical protein AK812_SmicGene23767 [Symbiodinium microadriaticum]|uniref:FHA domain-containing protein n=1 Tax=Symbiodinium microadriaticum TaxID=2951 RepID=A0A1Q9DGG0_SYMMI|nr:hypothetical protein AK812_SmicGene23767 [Symbiodinium microadriaticum]